MSSTNATVVAVIIACAFLLLATRRTVSWPWYACAAIILAACVYSHLKPGHWLSSWAIQ